VKLRPFWNCNNLLIYIAFCGFYIIPIFFGVPVFEALSNEIPVGGDKGGRDDGTPAGEWAEVAEAV
jgi:hypothetical protein